MFGNLQPGGSEYETRNAKRESLVVVVVVEPERKNAVIARRVRFRRTKDALRLELNMLTSKLNEVRSPLCTISDGIGYAYRITVINAEAAEKVQSTGNSANP